VSGSYPHTMENNSENLEESLEACITAFQGSLHVDIK